MHHQGISESHGILRMGSFLLENVSMEVLYLHQYQVYEQRLVYLLIPSITALYASNCSSSVGRLSRPMYKNSVRYNPTPSPPLSIIPCTSFGVPILATTQRDSPSLVTVAWSFTILPIQLFVLRNFAFFPLKELTVHLQMG